MSLFSEGIFVLVCEDDPELLVQPGLDQLFEHGYELRLEGHLQQRVVRVGDMEDDEVVLAG